MGLSLSVLSSAWNEIVYLNFFYLNETLILKSISLNPRDGEMIMRTISFKNRDSESMDNSGSGSPVKIIERSISFKNWEQQTTETEPVDDSVSKKMNLRSLTNEQNSHGLLHKWDLKISLPKPVAGFPINDLDAAATKLQKVYKSYRTRRNLADCAVVIEELWWKALDFAALERSSVSFFNVKKPETAASRWLRARTRAAKVGKGLSKDEKAQKLALQHWLEAIDPRHRYGHNLHFYYDVWSDSRSTQPFFYWLDVGDGKELNLEASCSRANLQRQCITYLAPKEREAFEVIVESGKLLYKQSGTLLTTELGSKWIFVLSTTRTLYVGQKKKGVFQHSSFLCGGATTAAGRLVASEGSLEAIWPYSGHYHPTEENFKEFIGFLEEHHVDLSNVKRHAIDEDYPSDITKTTSDTTVSLTDSSALPTDTTELRPDPTVLSNGTTESLSDPTVLSTDATVLDFPRPLSCKWSSGVGARIGCVREYPTELQTRALEQVSLSPGNTGAMSRSNVPIPSPRPSPRIRLSPRLSYMGIPSPRVH